jgi:hypothetical protein
MDPGLDIALFCLYRGARDSEKALGPAGEHRGNETRLYAQHQPVYESEKEKLTVMHTDVNRSAFSLGLALVLVLALSSPVWAQTVPTNSDYGVKSGSGDAAFGVGWSNIPRKLDPADTNNHPNFAFSGGVNLSSNLAVVGEYTYQPMSPLDGVAFHTQLFGGAARFSLGGQRVVPYVLVGGGGARLTGSESGVAVSANGGYFGGGGGAHIYLGRNWGIRPELRYNHMRLSISGVSQSLNVAQFSTGFFVQFGGESSNKKSAQVRQ